MRFLLDENVHGDTTDLLRGLGHDVVHVADSDWRAQPDERLIDACNEQGRIFVTMDVGVSLVARRLHTGLVLVRAPSNFDQRRVPQLVNEFVSRVAESDLTAAITVTSPGRAPRSTHL